MRKMRVWFVLAALFCSREALACAPAPPLGERINVVEEEALIVWEPATKTQHFIRRATFNGQARRFGFLVPTPGVPALTRVDDGVFDHLKRKTAPQIVEHRKRELELATLATMFFTMQKGATTTGSAMVDVIATQKVAGYEAAILRATDAKELHDWLAANGYGTTPELTEWLQVYVDQRWVITAFKIDKSEAAHAARTSAVRMSFATEQPFFPYREPASQREGPPEPRVLTVWFVGPERVTGRVAESAWSGKAIWSNTVRDLELGGVKLDPEARLTAFEDRATPRPGVADLFFVRDPQQQTVAPPPIHQTVDEPLFVPVDLLLAPVVIGGGWWWLRKRRRKIRD